MKSIRPYCSVKASGLLLSLLVSGSSSHSRRKYIGLLDVLVTSNSNARNHSELFRSLNWCSFSTFSLTFSGRDFGMFSSTFLSCGDWAILDVRTPTTNKPEAVPTSRHARINLAYGDCSDFMRFSFSPDQQGH